MASKLEESPVVRYLHQLEGALKQQAGITPEDALTDAREFLSQDLVSLRRSEPGLSNEETYQHFLTTFGTPEQVAQSYCDFAETNFNALRGTAPGWRICCTRCGRSAPADQAGITRIGARSIHKYVLGWCRECRRLRWLRLQRDLAQTNLTKGLGMSRTGAELRRLSHKPWLTLATILVLAFGLWIGVPLAISMLPGAETSPFPTYAVATPANKPAVAFDPARLFEALPSGWSIKSHFDVPARQLAALSGKLGGQIESLSNTVLYDGKTDLQINVVVSPDAKQAQSIYKRIRDSKSDPRHAFCQGKVVIEFVVRNVDQARFANRARYRLPIQPKQASYEIRFDAVPLKQGDSMTWNQLFNHFLQWHRPNQRHLAETLQDLLHKTACISDSSDGTQFSLDRSCKVI